MYGCDKILSRSKRWASERSTETRDRAFYLLACNGIRPDMKLQQHYSTNGNDMHFHTTDANRVDGVE